MCFTWVPPIYMRKPEIPVGKSNGSRHSVWEASENMGRDLMRCSFSRAFLRWLLLIFSTFAPSKGIQDSLEFLAVDPGFWILCQWNFLSGFQSLVVLRIPWVISRIPEAKFPGFRIPQAKSSRTLDSTSKISRIQDSTSKNFPESGIRIPLHGATTSSRLRTFHNFVVVRRRISFAIYFSIK